MQNRKVIVNGYVGDGWYKEGQLRLYKSILEHEGEKYKGYGLYSNEDIKMLSLYSKDCPYTCKAAVIKHAIELGYHKILWLDCSVTLLKPLDEFWEIVDKNGYYFMAGGWNCAQECNDRSLEYFGYTRDEAELIHSLWSCIFALDLRNEKAKKVCDLFLQAAKDGIFHGSRHHDNQSYDPRFKHHRQDQSVLSLAFHKVGLQIFHPPQIHMWYAGMNKEPLETNIFKVQGGI